MTNAAQLQQIERQLGEELLAIHEQTYGKGARSARVYYLDDTIVCLLDEIELLPNEQFLLGQGHGDGVVAARRRHEQATRAVFISAVERATGRRVVSFVSATKLSPNWAAEIFRLARTAASALKERGDE